MFGSPEQLMGRVIGGYRLERLLGTGAMGVVFQGRSAANPQATVAIKLLIVPWNATAEDRAQYQARFRREAQTLQRLRHPHILSVLDFGEAEGFTYMVLPYLEGGTLADLLQRQQRLALSAVSGYLTRLASALDYAHSQGVVHRDIKPGNILLDAQGQPSLADFSIVRFTDMGHTTLTVTGQVMGTPAYQAPEQAEGQQVGPAADIYSLGVVVYELVTGQAPFQANSISEFIKKHAQEPPPPPRTFRPELPEPATAALLQALAKRPADRFASAGAFARAFALGVQGQWVPEVRRPGTIAGDATGQFTPPPTVNVSPPPVQPRSAVEPLSPVGQPTPIKDEWRSASGVAGSQPPTISAPHPYNQGVYTLSSPTVMPLAPAAPPRKSRAVLWTLASCLLLVLVLAGSGTVLGAKCVGPLTGLFTGCSAAAPTATLPPTATIRPTSTPTITPPPKPQAGIITEFAVPTPASTPNRIARGLDRNLWFTETSGSKIGRISPDGKIDEFPTPTANSGLFGITAGPGGPLWFTETRANKIGTVTTGGFIQEIDVPTADSQPWGIAAGPDGNIWFTESIADKIGRVSPSTLAITEFPLPAGMTGPDGITAGSDGNLWFGVGGGGGIGRITTSGVISEYMFSNPQSAVNGITAGPDGNIWFTDPGTSEVGRITPGGAITEFPLPTADANLPEITTGPDGNLWFPEYQSNQIGRITPSGQVEEFALTTPGSNPRGIAPGPDGNVWFTESNANQIGRITTGQ